MIALLTVRHSGGLFSGILPKHLQATLHSHVGKVAQVAGGEEYCRYCRCLGAADGRPSKAETVIAWPYCHRMHVRLPGHALNPPSLCLLPYVSCCSNIDGVATWHPVVVVRASRLAVAYGPAASVVLVSWMRSYAYEYQCGAAKFIVLSQLIHVLGACWI